MVGGLGIGAIGKSFIINKKFIHDNTQIDAKSLISSINGGDKFE